jgi:hypothetical protein
MPATTHARKRAIGLHLVVGQTQILLGKVSNLDVGNFEESSVLGRTREVALAANGAVVLALRFVVLDPNPKA